MYAGDRDPPWGLGGQVGWNFGGYTSYRPDALIYVANGRRVVGETLNDGARAGIVVFGTNQFGRLWRNASH